MDIQGIMNLGWKMKTSPATEALQNTANEKKLLDSNKTENATGKGNGRPGSISLVSFFHRFGFSDLCVWLSCIASKLCVEPVGSLRAQL